MTSNMAIDIGNGITLTTALRTLETPSLVNRTHYAPQYGCFEVRAEDDWKAANGTRAQKVVQITRSIRMGDPDSALFSVAPDHREMKRSEVAKAYHFYKAKAQNIDPATAEAGWRTMSARLAAELNGDDERHLAKRAAAGLK